MDYYQHNISALSAQKYFMLVLLNYCEWPAFAPLQNATQWKSVYSLDIGEC